MRIDRVDSPGASARSDQYTSFVKERIRGMDRELHESVMREVALIRAHIKVAADNDLVEPVTALALTVATSTAMCMMNEMALEKWGIGGTNVDDQNHVGRCSLCGTIDMLDRKFTCSACEKDLHDDR